MASQDPIDAFLKAQEGGEIQKQQDNLYKFRTTQKPSERKRHPTRTDERLIISFKD